MKLEDTWKSLNTENQTIDHSEMLKSMNNKKADVMVKLQKKLIGKLIFAISFTLIYSLLLFFVKDSLVILLFAVLIGAHLLAIGYFLKEHRNMQKLIPMDGNILETLKEYQSRIRRVLKSEETGGLILYPVAVSAGFFFSLLADKSFTELMEDRWIWVIWISLMVGFTPVGHWLAKRMNKIAFGKHLNHLQEMISEIESTNQI